MQISMSVQRRHGRSLNRFTIPIQRLPALTPKFHEHFYKKELCVRNYLIYTQNSHDCWRYSLYPVDNPITIGKCSPEASRYHPLSCVAFVIYIRQYSKSQVSLTSGRSQLVKVSGIASRLSITEPQLTSSCLRTHLRADLLHC